jgi:hypothetical protein
MTYFSNLCYTHYECLYHSHLKGEYKADVAMGTEGMKNCAWGSWKRSRLSPCSGEKTGRGADIASHSATHMNLQTSICLQYADNSVSRLQRVSQGIATFTHTTRCNAIYTVTSNIWPCHITASRSGCLGSHPGQSMLDLLCPEWHWDGFLSQSFGFPFQYPCTVAPYSLLYHVGNGQRAP